ncbi:MAG TPA: hypothetical protein VJ276_22805 [Thermoanaerobaculia bacterium]|nr:hypothetical protein [Thermoanaerobaculia bacterium]
MAEPRRVVGMENDVRLDAEVIGDQLQTSTVISIKYDVTNKRDSAIAVADINPEATYDPETQTVTVSLGAEVPGHELVPRLISVNPGEKKTFNTAAHVNIIVGESASTPRTRFPNKLQIKLNFLGDARPFMQVVNIAERGVHDPKLADALFSPWLERNETIFTNSLPMRWNAPKEIMSTPTRRTRRP